jgi:RNA 2',3'-cyclic 3'-phosphodiesterase
MEQIRSFISIELSEGLKNSLKRLEENLSSSLGLPARWVNPNSIHLTLKFLGNIETDRLTAIKQAMQEAAGEIVPFELQTAEVGAFPDLKRVQVVWVGLGGQLSELQHLFEKLEHNLKELGFPPEERPFVPHLTLARIGDHATPLQRQEMGKLVSRTRIDTPVRMRVESINLMKSELTRQGAIHTCLYSARLKTGCE